MARVIYVDAGPLGAGQAINEELPEVDGEIPLPDWSDFDEPDLQDLDDDLRAAFPARAVPQPTGVAYDKQELADERRYDVPATIICCEFSSDQLRSGWRWACRCSPSSRPCGTSSTSTCRPATGPSSRDRPSSASDPRRRRSDLTSVGSVVLPAPRSATAPWPDLLAVIH